jgi:hypothetical protein
MAQTEPAEEAEQVIDIFELFGTKTFDFFDGEMDGKAWH